MMISSAPKVRSASSIACTGSPSPTSPRALIPSEPRRARLCSSRSPAAARAPSSSDTQCRSGEFSAGVTTSTSSRKPALRSRMQSRSVSPPTVSLATTRIRSSSSALRRGAYAPGGASSRRDRSQAQTTRTEATTNTAIPTHLPPNANAIPIAAKYASAQSRNWNASASLRSGFFMRASDDVDGCVDDDPHHVDEVPVDPGDLDAVVVVRGVVAAEGTDGGEGEQRQADEDVRAVEAGEGEEDRAEGAVVRGEADAGVLARLREQEDEPHQERQEQARLQAGAVAALDRLQR